MNDERHLEMKERPILFSAPMVRALINGTKTQTRRAVKGLALEWLTMENGFNAEFVALPGNGLCPYGQPGDQLWVREAFRDARGAEVDRVLYRATGDVACGWKPSIHMPRDCSRILLEIVSVRVERLKDISEADSAAEGIVFDPHVAVDKMGLCSLYRIAYRELWESINGPGSWEANPWVWVVELKRVKP